MRSRVCAGRVRMRPGTDLTRPWMRPTAQPDVAPAQLPAQPQTRAGFCFSAAPALCQLLVGTAVTLQSPCRGYARHQHPTGHPPLPGIGSPTPVMAPFGPLPPPPFPSPQSALALKEPTPN